MLLKRIRWMILSFWKTQKEYVSDEKNSAD